MTPALFSSLKVLTILPTKQKTEINETKNKQFLQNYLVTVVKITAHQSSLPMLRSRESWRDYAIFSLP